MRKDIDLIILSVDDSEFAVLLLIPFGYYKWLDGLRV